MPEATTTTPKDPVHDAALAITSCMDESYNDEEFYDRRTDDTRAALETIIAEAVRRAREEVVRDIEIMMRDSDFQVASLNERLKAVESDVASRSTAHHHPRYNYDH